MRQIWIRHRLWMIATLLYALSWSTYSGPNLSFLAWFAFVPLFFDLKRRTVDIKSFLAVAFIFITSWTVISAGWLFHFPGSKLKILACILNENLHITFPFLLLYLTQKRVGFDQAIILFPFMWVIWEWLYLPMQHTMGTHLLAYGQGSYLWFIQMADWGGMWLVSFWVLLINVSVYKLLTAHHWSLPISRRLVFKLLMLVLILIGPVWFYGKLRLGTLSQEIDSAREIHAAIIPTQFEAEYLMHSANAEEMVERTLYRNDSLAYSLTHSDRTCDLYVWPESGSHEWTIYENIGPLLLEAVDDWEGSLITGSSGPPPDDPDSPLRYVSGILFSPRSTDNWIPIQYHHKTRLIPINETIPYPSVLGGIPGLSGTFSAGRFSKGVSHEPLKLQTKSQGNVLMGVSLCYEQWFPRTWAQTVTNGATFFVHLAGEGWYGHVGFAQYMANVTRFRAIENRRSVVRSANIGLSTFIGPTGEFYDMVPLGGSSTPRAPVKINTHLTFFSQHPDLIPYLCIGILVLLLFRFTISDIINP